MSKDKTYQCKRCGAAAEKKKRICKPKKVKASEISEKDRKKKPCKGN